MTATDAALDLLVAQVVDEFRDAVKRGENPDVEEYAARHPEAAALLRNVLATFQFLDGSALTPLASTKGNGAASTDEPSLSGILGDFRIIRELGRGGMGIVYEAEQISLGRRIALKVLPFAAMMDPRNLQRFQNEARAAASLHHEHIVPVHAVGSERGVHYYAMQYIEGLSLAQLLEHLRTADSVPSGPAPTADSPASAPHAGVEPSHRKSASVSAVAQAARSTLADHPLAVTLREHRSQARGQAYSRTVAEWGIQAAEALEHAHQMGIVHRDIKPGNLLVSGSVSAEGGAPPAKLWVTDFGLARTAPDSGLTMTGDLIGTLRYMSPEQALGKHGLVDHRGDIYSLGATLFELLTLRPAVEGKDRQEILRRIAEEEPPTARRLKVDISADLETIILKTLAKDPTERYVTAGALAEDLRRFLDHQPIRAKRASLRQRLAKWAQRNRSLVGAALAAVIVIAAVLGGAAGIWYQRQEARQRQLTVDLDELLNDVDSQRSGLAAKISDPMQVSRLLSRIDDWKTHLEKIGTVLDKAKARAASDPDLITLAHSQRLTHLTDALAADESYWQLAKEFDDIRLASGLVKGVWNPGAIGKRYEKAFGDLGIALASGGETMAAKQIESHPLRYVLVAALDFWAMMSTDNEHVPTLLKTAALADPDAWRDRVRDPGIWSDDAALKELADNADMSRQSPHLAQLLAVRLKDKKLNPVPFLRDALTHHPNDFWLHLEAAEATTNWPDRIGHYYAALSVRSDSSPIHNNLAHVLQRVGDMPGTVRHFTRAIESDPDHIVAHIGLADALARMRDSDGAQRERLIASQLAMTNACDRDSLGQATAIHLALIRSFGRSDDVPMMRLHIDKALELVDGSPDNVIDKDTAFGLRMAQRDLGTILYRLKDYEGALPYLEAVKNDRGLADPDRLARLYGDIADMWRSRNDLPKAKAWYQKYVLYQHSRSYFPVPPGPIAHPLTGNRFETACATVVVAPHSSMNRQLTRYQALVWLRTDLDRWLQAVQTVEGRRLIQIRDALRTWQTTVDLASVRDPDKMSKLPAAERLAWELLWADIEQILAQPENKLLDGVADATKPPTRRTAAPQAQDLFLLACAALRSGQTKSGERASSSRADALQYLRAALDAWVTRIGDYSPGSVIEASESLELWQITPELAMAHRKSSATQQRK